MVRYLGKNLVLNSPETMMIEGQECSKDNMLAAKGRPVKVGNIMKDSILSNTLHYLTSPFFFSFFWSSHANYMLVMQKIESKVAVPP